MATYLVWLASIRRSGQGGLFGYYSKGFPSPKLIIIFEDTSYMGIMKEKLTEIRKIGV
ncbi:hypothetical protein IID24_04215 [Patescibacteria group bacterium]|nr:hypothetical protein [Patescibacteria group bacterium]